MIHHTFGFQFMFKLLFLSWECIANSDYLGQYERCMYVLTCISDWLLSTSVQGELLALVHQKGREL